MVQHGLKRGVGVGGILKNLNDSTVNGYEVSREMNVFEFSFHFFSLPRRRNIGFSTT